jgi:hypothetical protein
MEMTNGKSEQQRSWSRNPPCVPVADSVSGPSKTPDSFEFLATLIPLIIFIFIAFSCVGCGRNDSSTGGGSAGSGRVSSTGTGGGTGDGSSSLGEAAPVDPDNQQEKDAALQPVKKLRESAPPKIVGLPNFESGPHRPPPILQNFYEVLDEYPAYLVCIYDVDESYYDSSKEPSWFQASLLQIRNSGRRRFYSVDRGRHSILPLKWVAVIIRNRAEHMGASTFEQSHKAGAIFNIDEVFDPSCNLSQLVVAVQMDRHPFVYNPKWSEDDRWVIVKRHAATTRPVADLK